MNRILIHRYLRILLFHALFFPPTTAFSQSRDTSIAASDLDLSTAPSPGTSAPADALNQPNSICTLNDNWGNRYEFIRPGPSWSGWSELCEKFINYIQPQTQQDTSTWYQQIRGMLMPLGYFRDVTCESRDTGAIRCTMLPSYMVSSYQLHGHIPIALLASDLRQRVFLRPGSILRHPNEDMEKQRNRLQSYLQSEGYLDARVHITAVVVDGVEPNAGLHLAITSQPGHAYTIGDIFVKNAPDNTVKKIQRQFRHAWIGNYLMRFRPNKFNEDILAATQYLQSEGWVTARIDGDYSINPKTGHVDLTLQVHPGYLANITLHGNDHFSDKKLKHLAKFEQEGSIDSASIESFRHRIMHQYQRKGFANVDVQTQTTRVSDKVIDIDITIQAGEKLPIRSVHFRNIGGLNLGSMLERVRLLSKPSSGFFDHYWIDSYIEHDIRVLETYLRSIGFEHALVSTEQQVNDENDDNNEKSIDLAFIFEPKGRKFIDKIDINSTNEDIRVYRKALYKRLQQRPKKPFVRKKFDNDAQEIQAYLISKGHQSVEVIPSVTEHPQYSNKVNITYLVEMGAQSKFGGLFLRGQLRTSPQILKQELNLHENDFLDLVSLGATRRRLRSYGIFNTVQISPLTPYSQNPKTWLLLSVEERSVQTLDAVGAFSSDYYFSLGADYRDRNWLGRAMVLNVQTRLSNASEVITPRARIGNRDLLTVTLRAPRPFGHSFDVDGSLSYVYQDMFQYRERRMGGIVALSRPLLQRSRCHFCPTILGKLSYEVTQAYRVDKTNAPTEELAHSADTTIARVFPSISASYWDSAIDPMQGYHFNGRFEFGYPGFAFFLGDRATSFWRLLSGTQLYYNFGTPASLHLGESRRLGGPIVAAAALQYNAAAPWGHAGSVPASETFGYGGDLSVRGLVNRASGEQLDNAHYLLTGNFELRWYILPDFGFGTVQLAGFVDAGTVATEPHLLGRETTVSVGPVLRYVTQIGPLSIAYGKAIILPAALRAAPRSAPPSGRLHITFGYNF